MKDEAYRVYVTDALKIICENTAKYAGGNYPVTRFCEAIHPKPTETRSPQEIIDRIKQKLKEVSG